MLLNYKYSFIYPKSSDGSRNLSNKMCFLAMLVASGVTGLVLSVYNMPSAYCLNTTAYLSIVSNRVHPFITSLYPSSDGCFQRDIAPCHKGQIVSNWFILQQSKFTVLK